MIKFLIWFKRKFPSIWIIAESVNGLIFSFLHSKKLTKNLVENMEKQNDGQLVYRFIKFDDLKYLEAFFKEQDQEQFKFFKPHSFDVKTLKRLLKNPSFIMMGVFDGDKIAGYFFLRCFINSKVFVGRVVDGRYQGKGIAKTMAKIMHISAWSSKLRIFSTVSSENFASIFSHKAISEVVVREKLDNGYLLLEYLKVNSLENNNGL